MKNDDRTELIIQKGTEYLVGLSIAGNLRWSNSIYDAWRTKDKKAAKFIAKRVNGNLMLFNPINGDRRGMECSGYTGN